MYVSLLLSAIATSPGPPGKGCVRLVPKQVEPCRRLFAQPVAADAVAIEHRLDAAHEAEAAFVLGAGQRLGVLTDNCLRGNRSPCLAGCLGFMASDASDHLAGADVHQAAHGHHGHTVLVERLELEAGIRGNLEGGGSVFIDRHVPITLLTTSCFARLLSVKLAVGWS